MRETAILGEVLSTARAATGWTQERLAKQAGVTQAALSRYENDLRRPDPETLEKLAGALGVTGGLLERAALMRGGLALHAHARQRASASVRVWQKAEARLNILRLQMHRLLGMIDLDVPNTLLQLDPLDYEPEVAARLTRAQWGMTMGPVRGVTGWMESAGCVVLEWDFGTPRIDALSQWVDEYPVVMVNSALPTDRQRLTLAHELGHLVIHGDPVHLSSDAEVEREAMKYAAEFLMPAHVIRPDLRNLSLGKLSDLKRYWMVSMAALVERAHNLRTITDATRISLYKALSARGWRKREPLSEQLPPEQSSIPALIVEELYKLRYTAGEIAEFGGFADEERAARVLPLRRGLRVIR